jgi:hypothetical protein
MRTRAQLEEDRTKLKDQIAEIQSELNRRKSLPIEQQIAEELHDLMCHGNHTDDCPWGYEDWNNLDTLRFSAKGHYLAIAKRTLQVSDPKTVMNILKAMGEE